MANPSATEQADARRERAEARARRHESESVISPRTLNVDAAAIKRRDVLAAELLSLYEFLTTLYLPDDCIKRPPKGGWPSITAERLEFLGKTDAVIDLLKHIPYISQDVEEEYQIQEKCICNDYTGKLFERRAIKYQARDAMEPLPGFMEEKIWDKFKEPQHVATLAQSASADAGYHIFFDTRDGQLAEIEFVDGNCVTYDSAKESFDSTKDSFRGLDMLPTEPTEVIMSSGGPFSEEQIGAIKDIFKKHGWPTNEYHKEPCMAEVQELWDSYFKK